MGNTTERKAVITIILVFLAVIAICLASTFLIKTNETIIVSSGSDGNGSGTGPSPTPISGNIFTVIEDIGPYIGLFSCVLFLILVMGVGGFFLIQQSSS